MQRKINYSDDYLNPDVFYVVCHFNKDGSCKKEYVKLTPCDIPGITKDVITVIRNLNKEERQNNLRNDRYLTDPRYKAAKARRKDLDETVIMDKFHNHMKPSPDPDEALKDKPSFIDKVHSLLPLLTNDQRRLYELTKEDFSLQEIADLEGTTKNAIASRMKKLHARLYRLYELHFGNK